MPSTDSKITSMEDLKVVENGERSISSIPSSPGHTTSLLSSPSCQTTERPNCTGETVIENKAVSMVSADCSSALSSPVEGSPAKPAVTPTNFGTTNENSPATSCTASASDSLKITGMSLVKISESQSLPLCVLPSTTFGSKDTCREFPAALTFKGVTVTLENNSVWKQFHSCGTEMILTKQGRRMFPYCRYRLVGLDPDKLYSLVLSILPSDQKRYRWNASKWEPTGPAERHTQGVIRAYAHHYSTCKGSEWMSGLVSFYKLKLTNNSKDLDGHIILHSMHRYIPRLHVIPVPDGGLYLSKPMILGPESMTFTFPQTEFMAVTTYQNFRITQLKINHNPFAKGFRDDGNNSRLNRVNTDIQPLVKVEPQLSVLKPTELNEGKELAVDVSIKDQTTSDSVSTVQGTRLVLKPIMSTSALKDEPYVPCIRGKHALGELVLVEKRPRLEPKEENHPVSLSPEMQKSFTEMSGATSMSPTCSTSTPRSSLGYRKRRKRMNRRWGNSRGREWKASSASPTVVHSPSLTVSMQPELDDVEGLLFVSFTTQEALEVHIRDRPAHSSSSVSLVSKTCQMQLKETEVNPETDEEKISRLENILVLDLRLFKHRQVIHPVLQEVGLKLSSLDPTKSIDLQYLGVDLPVPPPILTEKGNETARSFLGLPFISRTGKTSDLTKIKGWKNKFIRSKEISPKCDGQQKNLSAFCSNRLDEYLESEAQQITERAAAFSTNPESSVAYQLPAKSSSYVKTLDSVLKERKSVCRIPLRANRPCPLSYKPLLYTALTSPPPPLPSPADQAEAQSMQQSTSSSTKPGAENASDSGNTGLASEKFHHGVSQKSAFLQNQGLSNKPSGLTKFQFKLLQMEAAASNQGLSRTQLTPHRLSVALSVILTKEMLPNQVLKVAQYAKYNAGGPECGQEFCRLGCVCSSLNHPNRGPLHCQRPECMFGCACFKRKITKQMSAAEYEHQSQPVYSMSNMEHIVQPRPGSQANKLWSHNVGDVDPEPLFIPKCPQSLVGSKGVKRGSVPRPTQPVREEDKDPVYRYFESMMTCARVREFNSKPPPIVSIEPPGMSTAKTVTKPQKMTTKRPKQYYRTITTVRKSAENTSHDSSDSETEARKQIQIQSACDWSKDRKTVLDALSRRMSQKRLSQHFYVGPYLIRPLTKIFMRKPSGSIVNYRVQISKQSKDTDSDVEEFDDSDEEKHTNENGEMYEEEEDNQIEDLQMQFGVTPFLSRIVPAGRLRARTKPSGCQAHGLIQVNGKYYNQARLLLGNMGSLHPANRLAAYVTGRISAPGKTSHKNSQKTEKNNLQSDLHIKSVGTVVPPIITARKTSDLMTPKQPAQQFQPDSSKKETTPLLQRLQNSSTTSPVQVLLLSQPSPASPFLNSSTSSPVSLTVSPSLKTPSFLGQSGTYSFRICPPANPSTKGENLPGVTLPGGFTLIQLPKPLASEAEKKSDSVNVTNTTRLDKGQPQKFTLLNFDQSMAANKNWFGVGALNAVKDLSSCKVLNVKMPSDNPNEIKRNLDIASEDLSSNSSDYCGDDDDDEEMVDIETVEDMKQEKAIQKMKDAVEKASQDSRDDFRSAREHDIQHQVDDDQSRGNTRRRNHVVLERQRRSEQRTLFDKLQTVLESDPKSPRLRLLSTAVKEIRNLVSTSKYLEEQKRSLMQMQSLYMKQLSLLSGKSEKLIKSKLNEICERQKMKEKTMKWKPYFSHLLQSRAALLQAISPQETLKDTPLLQPDFFMASSQAAPLTTASLKTVSQCTPLVQPSPQTLKTTKVVSPLSQIKVTSLQLDSQPSGANALFQVDQNTLKAKDQDVFGAPAQKTTPDSQSQSPTVQCSMDLASSKKSRLKSAKPPPCSTKPVAFPLIRSKTGRLILPSSLKPVGQGFYTLMLMKANKKNEADEATSSANLQPSDVDSKNQDKSCSATDQHSESENSHMSEEDKTASSGSDPKHSGVLTDIAFHNKSANVPTTPLQASEKSQEVGAEAVLTKTLATACLSFKCVPQVSTAVEAEPYPDSLVAQRRRGRPRKSSSPLLNVTEKHTVTRQSTQAQKKPISVDADNPVQGKRKRGRPPKNKLQGYISPLEEDDDDNLLSYRKIKRKLSKEETESLGKNNTSRPLTRGALGKDFPSAKKRSWIDVEKELEPELEDE